MTGALFFFSALGAFNGLILSIYLLLVTKFKTTSKSLLGLLILSLSIRIGKSVIMYFNDDTPKLFLQIGLTACLFIGPFLYFYLRSVVQCKATMPRNWIYTLVSIAALGLFVGIRFPYEHYPAYWNPEFVTGIYVIWLLFTLAAGYTIRQQLKAFALRYSISPKDKWLSIIYIFNLTICFVFVLVLYGVSRIYYLGGPIVFSFFIYILIYGYFYRDQIEFSSHKPIRSYANKRIEDAEAAELLARIKKTMEDVRPYVNSKFKLDDLAELLSISRHQLSQLLNDNMGKSFRTFINEHRIDLACELLASSNHLSLEGIGYEVGFRSKSTFFIAFKKIKGMTPAAYQKNMA